MRIDIKPFDDNNVRQALRLIVNRKQMVKQVLNGHGKIGNDLYGYIDEFYNANNFKQREQDIPAAVALLKKSGYTKSNPLKVELTAPDDTGGLVLMIQAFAEMAKKTDGVVVIDAKIIDGGTYWSSKGQYMNTGFFTTYWSPRNYLAQVAASMDVYPETKWPAPGTTFRADYEKAVGTNNKAKRKEIVARMQKEEFEKGGYIIPFFNNFADAFSTKLKGVDTSPSQLNMGYFGHGFKGWYLA
jgi:peptide/nickel transport system substrate-binding protein